MTNTLKKIIVVSFIALFVFSAFSIAVDLDDAYADEPIIITDSTGKELILNAPAEKVATLGYGFTKTVVDLGGKDKIVAYDLYSEDLINELGIEGFNVGSSYSSNKNTIVSSMILAKVDSLFDVDTDVIIINNYSGTISENGTRDKLEEQGFKVLCFGANDYEGVVYIVENIAKAIGKESSAALTNMISARDSAYEAGKDIADEDKVTAMYVNEYGGGLRIYNEGIAVSMIELAGGKNVGFNSNISTTYYSSDASAILLLRPDVVFLDGNHSMSAKDFQKKVLRTKSIEVIKMEKDWNNYCPSSAVGLSVVSEAMLEEYDHDESIWDIISINIEMTVAGLLAAILVIAGLLVMRRV